MEHRPVTASLGVRTRARARETERTSGRAVGLYGRGPTVVLAVPLWERYSEELRTQLTRRPGTEHLPQGELVTAGPLTLLLGERDGGRAWLVAGTVTADAAVAAVEELDHLRPRRGEYYGPGGADGASP